MPSFDIVNKVDSQELDNAINNTRKEIDNRYDFRGTHTEVNFLKKDHKIHLVAAEEMKMNAVKEMLARNMAKRGISPKILEYQRIEGTSHGAVKMDILIQEGISRETAKEIVKEIKNLGLKVQPAIQDEQVRVSGKSIDDLQKVIQHLKSKDYGIPLQFVNLK